MINLKLIKKAVSLFFRILFAGITFLIIYLGAFLLNIFLVSWVYASSPCSSDCADMCPSSFVNAWSNNLPWGSQWVGLKKTENGDVIYNQCTVNDCPNCDQSSEYSCQCISYSQNCTDPQNSSVSYLACWESLNPMAPVTPPTPEQLACGSHAPCPACSHINQFTCQCDSVAPDCGHRDVLPSTCTCGCLTPCDAPFVRDSGWCNCYCSQGIDYFIDLTDCINNPTWNVNGTDPYGYGRLDSTLGNMKFKAIVSTYPNWVWGLTLDPLVSCELHSMGCAFYPELNETDCDIDNGIVGYVNSSSFSMVGFPMGYYMFHCPMIPANCDYSYVNDDSNVFYWTSSSLVNCEIGCSGENCPPISANIPVGGGKDYFTNTFKRGSKSVGYGGCEKRDNP